MRTLDFHRGLVTLVGAGAAGFLIWLATEVGQHSTARFWASMGIVAGAGLVMAASQLLGGWTKFGWPRFSPDVFLLAFLPVLVCTAWILLANQPGHGWHEGRIASWSSSIGILGLVHALGLYHGVLAFGFGLVFGYCFDTAGIVHRDAAAAPSVSRDADPVGAGTTTPEPRRVEIREDGRPVERTEQQPVD